MEWERRKSQFEWWWYEQDQANKDRKTELKQLQQTSWIRRNERCYIHEGELKEAKKKKWQEKWKSKKKQQNDGDEEK